MFFSENKTNTFLPSIESIEKRRGGEEENVQQLGELWASARVVCVVFGVWCVWLAAARRGEARRGDPSAMFLTISTGEELGDRVVQIDVGAEETVENVKCILEAETGVVVADQVLILNGKEVTVRAPGMENRLATLADHGVKNNDLMMLLSKKLSTGGGAGAAASG